MTGTVSGSADWFCWTRLAAYKHPMLMWKDQLLVHLLSRLMVDVGSTLNQNRKNAMVTVLHRHRQGVSAVAGAAGRVGPLANTPTAPCKRQQLNRGCVSLYLIQEPLDDANLTSTRTQLLQQLRVLHLDPGEAAESVR